MEDHMLTKNVNMRFLSLHTLAAARGDGLRPEFVKLFTRLAAAADATRSRIRSTTGRIGLRTSNERFGFEQAAPQECVGRRKY
jgi:hypothetical protein